MPVKSRIRTIPDYPKKGIMFRDITTLIKDPVGFRLVIDNITQRYISNGVSAHPTLHDANSNSKIWRYAQRAHFHATGIAAFSIGLIVLVMFSSLKDCWKKYTAILIGVGGLYPLSWFSMFVLAPSIGRNAAHHHIITEVLAYCGVGGLLLGITILSANLFLGMFQND